MSTTSPAVSVVIPAYQVTRYITETVESALQQTFANYEIIVVNDGCPDSEALERALDPYRHRLVYLRKENGGLASARNAGMRLSRAPLVAFLDGDDAWAPDYLSVQTDFLDKHPAVDVVYPNGVFIGDRRVAGRELMEFSPSNGAVTLESLVSLKCAVFYSVTARKEVLLRLGGFDESLRRVEDFDMWLRVVMAGGRIEYHHKPLLRYRQRGDSLSSDSVAMLHTDLHVLQKLESTHSLSQTQLTAVRQARRHFLSMLAYHSGRVALRDGDATAALIQFRELNKYKWTPKNALRIALIRFTPKLARKLMRQSPR